MKNLGKYFYIVMGIFCIGVIATIYFNNGKLIRNEKVIEYDEEINLGDSKSCLSTSNTSSKCSSVTCKKYSQSSCPTSSGCCYWGSVTPKPTGLTKKTNPITVTASQSLSTKYSTSAKVATFKGATNAQGAVTYKIVSQKNNSKKNVAYFSIPTSTSAKIKMAAKTPVGIYTITIRITAAGNTNYNSGSKDIKITVKVNAVTPTPKPTVLYKKTNPISVVANQSLSATYSNYDKEAAFKGATNAQGTLTYKVVSQKSNSGKNVAYFSIPTSTRNTIKMVGKVAPGEYTVVIRATAAGNTNYNSGSKDITITVTVKAASPTPKVTGKATATPKVTPTPKATGSLKKTNPITVAGIQNYSVTYTTAVKIYAFKAATNAEGAVTYKIISQKNSNGKTVSNFTISLPPNPKIQIAAKTPVGIYTIVIRATAEGNSNYYSGSKDITININVKNAVVTATPTPTSKKANPITVTASQTLSTTYSTSNKTASFKGATNAQGSITYKIISQKNSSGKSVSNFSIPTSTTAKIKIAAKTTTGTYTLVVRATSEGNSSYKSGSKDITIKVTVKLAATPTPTAKKTNSIKVTASQTLTTEYSTSAKVIAFKGATNAQGTVSYKIVSQKNSSKKDVSYFTIPMASSSKFRIKEKTTPGTYVITIRASATGNVNYNSGSKDITMKIVIKSATPTPKPVYDITKDTSLLRNFKVYKEYSSSTLNYKILSKSGESNRYYTVVWVKDANKQINSGVQDSAKVFTSILASEIKTNSYYDKGMVAINGSFMTGSGKVATPIVLSHGKLVQNNGYSLLNYANIGINKDGKIVWRLRDDTSIAVLQSEGIQNTWAGNTCKTSENVSSGIRGADFYTQFGQVDEHNFVLFSGYISTLGDSQINLVKYFGVKRVCNMDGGGSVRLFYKKASSSATTMVITGRDPNRRLNDALYFVEQ